MYLTSDIIAQYEGCTEGANWFARHFPQGAELIDVIRTRHIPVSFLHWGRLNLTTTEEERRAYDEVLNITNSTNYFQCQGIDHCDMITESKNVKNSTHIYRCEDVEDSDDITNSYKVKDSKAIIHSNSIYSSSDVVSASNIKQSHNISKSSFIISSSDIYDSSLITDSRIILQSKNIQSSIFLMDCIDSHHCILCDELKGASYQIFNHSIDPVQWEFIRNEMDEFIDETGSLVLFDHWDPEDASHGTFIHSSYLIMFEKLLNNERFVDWIKHLPFYSDMLAYKITFHPSFLE